MAPHFYLGIDVGTGSARAGIFDASGGMRGMGVEPIHNWRPQEDFVEQSSDEIWEACGRAVRVALTQAGLEGGQIRGIGFDATCSLVVLGEDDAPQTVSPTGASNQNVIVWMDHRAVEQAERITATGHEVLRYVGGIISPEMETPKLLWLKEHMPDTWKRATRFFDLPDFLSYRATGVDARSMCTTVCKWTYLGHEDGPDGEQGSWDAGFFEQVGLDDLAQEGFTRIGQRVRPIGERVGELTERSATELGLAPGIPVASSIIDAHAGGLGLLGTPVDGCPPEEDELETRLALISGTSSCHMAVSREPRFIPGIWGPYYSAMVPGLWLTEGGQSATGALIDHVVHSHARAAGVLDEAERRGTSVYAVLNERLDAVSSECSFPAELTVEFHVLPYFHGNRSPRANPRLRGMVTGLKLSDSVDALALLYLATIQAIAYGTRHILEEMNAKGYRIDTLIACGGDTKNPVFVREHADITGCRIALPKEPEAVLLGSAMMGAVASGDYPSMLSAMGAMSTADGIVEPAGGEIGRYHDRKYRVFRRMYEDQVAYGEIMR
ncbi:MAG: FGGY-family carbohydrate kinase [Pseudomonadales bacterium]